MSEARLQEVYRLVEQAIADSVFPGAVLLVARRGVIVAERGFGHHTYDPQSPPVRPNTLYDLASVTKVVATTTATMILYDRHQLDLKAPVQRYLPEFRGPGKDRVTVWHLLTHTSGLPAWKPLFKEAKTPEGILQNILETELIYPPGDSTVYSDLGMILLGKVIERVSGKPLDQFCREEIFEPLGMRDTYFCPPESLRYRIAPTEFDPWRGRLVHGEVHDENAYALGGVAGHAGLFSTARDLATFLQMVLNGGVYGHTRLAKFKTVRLFTSRQNVPPYSTRALGWDTPSPEKSSAGEYFSTRSFGHLGFTGTSVWVDPEKALLVVFLINRVHPTRRNIKIRRFRPQLHNAIAQAITDMEVRKRRAIW